MKTPWCLRLLQLLPLFWLAVLLTADADSLQAAARALPNDTFGREDIRSLASEARIALLSVTAAMPASETAGRFINLFWPQGWLLGRIDAMEGAALLFAARTASGLRLLAVTGLFWLASLYDGLVMRRVAFLTFEPYRPILAMNAGTLAALLLAAAISVLAAPFAHAEGAAVTLAAAGGAMANLWVRSFHRFAA